MGEGLGEGDHVVILTLSERSKSKGKNPINLNYRGPFARIVRLYKISLNFER